MNARVLDPGAPPAATAEPSGELETLLRARSQRTVADPTALRLGHIAAIRADGTVEVEFAGSGGGIPARIAAAVSLAQLETAVERRQQVALMFENGDPAKPILIGLIIEPTPAANDAAAKQVVEAEVDGKRVRIVAQDEIVLECGNASVTLRRNGRVVIRGTYVETYSEGTNRIKGGQVRIN